MADLNPQHKQKGKGAAHGHVWEHILTAQPGLEAE